MRRYRAPMHHHKFPRKRDETSDDPKLRDALVPVQLLTWITITKTTYLPPHTLLTFNFELEMLRLATTRLSALLSFSNFRGVT